MEICILAVGKIKEKSIKEIEKGSIARIRIKHNIKVIEIVDEPDDPGLVGREKEADRLISKIPVDSKVILLDVSSKLIGSDEIKKELNCEKITFLIGGSNGFGKNIMERYTKNISFSKMTYPHQLARIILLDILDKM